MRGRRPNVPTDKEVILETLRKGPASTNQLLAAGFAANGVGLDVRSRVADARRVLAASGETIVCGTGGRTRAGRVEYVYEIVMLVPDQLQLVLSTQDAA
jgi:hypothetical protein